jgi:hypothetical protein
MSRQKPAPRTYIDRVLQQLALLESDYLAILERSQIRNTPLHDRIRPSWAGRYRMDWDLPDNSWDPGPPELEALRLSLLVRLREWAPRYRLLFPEPTSRVSKTLDQGLALMERWLVRDGQDPSIPGKVSEAIAVLRGCVAQLRELALLLPADPWPVRLVIDTNALIDNPDVAVYTGQLGPRYLVHLLPVVLRELDDLKRAGRVETLREAAKKAERHLKGMRTNGDVTAGVRVAGDVHAIFESREPRSTALPGWLDLTVPDDRFVASALLLQSRHPGSVVYVATSDINMQTKLAAVAMPFIEP